MDDLATTLLVCGDEHRRNFADGAKDWNEDQLRRYGEHASKMLDAYEHQLGEMVKTLNQYAAERRIFNGIGGMMVSHLAVKAASNVNNG